MPPSQQPNLGVIMEKIENISADVAEIKILLTGHVDAQTRFEQETLSSRAVTKEQLGVVQAQIIDHEKRLKASEDILRRLIYTDTILRWVAVTLMGSIITLIWGILTHQVVLGFP